MYTNRVLEVLDSMQNVTLHALPPSESEPWTVDHFCDSIEHACRSSAIELNRKSIMVEEAVEEILNLVKKARIDVKNVDDEDLFQEGNLYINL